MTGLGVGLKDGFVLERFLPQSEISVSKRVDYRRELKLVVIKRSLSQSPTISSIGLKDTGAKHCNYNRERLRQTVPKSSNKSRLWIFQPFYADS